MSPARLKYLAALAEWRVAVERWYCDQVTRTLSGATTNSTTSGGNGPPPPPPGPDE